MPGTVLTLDPFLLILFSVRQDSLIILTAGEIEVQRGELSLPLATQLRSGRGRIHIHTG